VSNPLDSLTKRAMDLTLAGAGLLVGAPLMAVIAAAIVLADGDSPIYVQKRVGKDGKLFRLLKFRTMTSASKRSQQGGEVTLSDDPRITQIGHLLRRVRLDELPQLLNILKGEMSVVGPRPEVPKYVALYDDEQRQVLAVKPGLTDPATIRYRNEAELLDGADDPDRVYIEEVMPEKLRINLAYLAERSTAKDLGVFLQTLLTLAKDRAEGDG
jgi:lipopolysaccharide/colanic/teichoic acid biosynthesis glycosyltransferase